MLRSGRLGTGCATELASQIWHFTICDTKVWAASLSLEWTSRRSWQLVDIGPRANCFGMYNLLTRGPCHRCRQKLAHPFFAISKRFRTLERLQGQDQTNNTAQNDTKLACQGEQAPCKSTPSLAEHGAGCTAEEHGAPNPWGQSGLRCAHWKHGRRSKAFVEARKQIWAELRRVERSMRASGLID